VASGLGNGSTYKMIPALFRERAVAAIDSGVEPVVALAQARRRSGAVIGIAGAVGALGGVGVNMAFRQSFLTRHNGNGAYLAFVICYLACAALTWVVYLRPRQLAVPAAVSERARASGHAPYPGVPAQSWRSIERSR
jgi:NNP family nitrate/nitrite transporter-like MFS transporter